MKRTQLFLIGILVVQLALAGFTLWPRSNASSTAAGPLFANLNASDVVALTVYDKPETSIKLARQGGNWVLPGADDYPADNTKVDGFLTKVVALKTNRLVTKTEASQARLQVAASQYLHRIDFQTGDGASRTLYIGSASGARATNVRAGDRPEVYLAEDLNTSDASAQAGTWINPTYLTVTTTETSKYTLKNANGQFDLSKDASGNWTLAGLAAGETINTSNVEAVMNIMTSVQMSEPLGKTAKPEYGMDKPLAVMTLTTRKDNQEKTYTLTVGALQPGASGANSYVVKSSESPYYVKVSEYTVKDLVDKKRADFLQAPPTPAAGAAGAASTPAPFQALPTTTP